MLTFSINKTRLQFNDKENECQRKLTSKMILLFKQSKKAHVEQNSDPFLSYKRVNLEYRFKKLF